MNRKTFKNLVSIVLSIMFFLLVIILSLTSASAYTYEEQTKFCNDFNYTFKQCYDLWNFVDNYQNYTECVPENNTVYLNNCSEIEVEKNCSEEYNFLTESNRHLEELARIEGGGTCPSDVISNSDCDLKVSNARSVNNPPVTNSSSGDGISKYFPWILFGFIGLGFFYFKYWKNKGSSIRPVSIPVVSTTPEADFVPKVIQTPQDIAQDKRDIKELREQVKKLESEVKEDKKDEKTEPKVEGSFT